MASVIGSDALVYFTTGSILHEKVCRLGHLYRAMSMCLTDVLNEFAELISRISRDKEFHTLGPECRIDFCAKRVLGLFRCILLAYLVL